MRISIFGLGYVGCVTAACLAQRGHQVIGVDINPQKVETLGSGRCPVVEPHLPEMTAEAVQQGHLRATTDATAAVQDSEISLICVGTPSQADGKLDLSYVRRTAEELGRQLRDKHDRHTVVVRSTVLPGSTQSVVVPALEAEAQRRLGDGLAVVVNPEFLREGSAVQDFDHPARTVIGEASEHDGDPVAELYAHLDAPIVRTDLPTAEMVKYADNAFHAVKIAFANEIGNLCKRQGIDGARVMEIFALDTKLNLSPTYLRPGFAFGGSCLPKDLRAIIHRAAERNLPVPLLEAAIQSNECQKQRALEMIARTGQRRIGVLGLTFKAGTDDLRESPTVDLIERLAGDGYSLLAYDRHVQPGGLLGANLAYMQHEVPGLAQILRSNLDEVIAGSDVLVIANRDAEFRRVPELARDGQLVIDLVRAVDKPDCLGERYHGICW